MRSVLRVLLLAALVVTLPQAAWADVTVFVGLSPTPENRALRGASAGFGLVIVGFEFEYASLVEDPTEALPALRTGAANVLLQTPIDVSGVSLYATAGAGLYRENLEARQETNVATNAGGGIKVKLAGPLRLRLDYRVFRLRGSPLYPTYQRFYAGANLAF
ncbi:MAG: hypothetical protein ACT4QD_10530 [Acidobacteriota bacterium]